MASALFPPRRTTPWWPYLPATTWARAAEELFRRAGLPGRFSFSVFNSEDEADMAIQAVKDLAQSK